MLTLPEVKTFLQRYFTGLSLVNTDTEKGHHTFKYQDFDAKALAHVEPTVTNDGKVVIFPLGDAGKIGVSPSNHIVRFIDSGKRTTEPTSEDRLSKLEDLPPEFEIAYSYAQVNVGHRILFMQQLWTWLNREKFEGRMHMPKMYTGMQCQFSKKDNSKTVGMYGGGPNFSAGMLWINTKAWKGRLPFFVETFIHEMCHQASWCIDKSTDRTLEGHGPSWQAWMRKLGLKPDQYDMHDEVEYMVGPVRHIKDVEQEMKYGKRVPDTFWHDKRRLEDPDYHGLAWMNFKGRALKGELETVDYGNNMKVWFNFEGPDGPDSFVWKDKKKWERIYMPSFYVEK